MNHWVRLWADMPNDPKWRVVAKRARRPIAEVIAVFVHMMLNAGASPDRGSLSNWSDEDVAEALDAKPEHVAAIRKAMQGKTLDGDHLTGWENRQPKRERDDGGSAERGRAFRERKKAEQGAPDGETPPNATERQRTQDSEHERHRAPRAEAESESDTDPAAALPREGREVDPDLLGARLRDAAGLLSDPNPTLFDLSPIFGLIDGGYDLETEILPAIRAKAGGMRRPARSWGYFVGAVQDSRERRTTAARPPPHLRVIAGQDAPGPSGPYETSNPLIASLMRINERDRSGADPDIEEA